MRAYIISDSEMKLLHTSLENYFRVIAERKGENWSTISLDNQKATVYDGYHAANFVIHRWLSEISK